MCDGPFVLNAARVIPVPLDVSMSMSGGTWHLQPLVEDPITGSSSGGVFGIVAA